MPPFICNIFKCKFKSCLRNSLHCLWKKFILNIDLELILHNISCGVKRIPPNVQTNISNYLYSSEIHLNVTKFAIFLECYKKNIIRKHQWHEMWVLIFQIYTKMKSFLLEHFIKHKPIFLKRVGIMLLQYTTVGSMYLLYIQIQILPD